MLILLRKDKNLRLSWLLICCVLEPGRILNLKLIITMLKESLVRVDIFILFYKSENNLKRFSLRWALKKCLLIGMLKAPSGTLMHFFNRKVILLVICTIHFSLKTQQIIALCQKLTKMKWRKFIQREDSDPRDMNMTGRKMRQARIYCVHILPQFLHKCFTN